jgi:ASCH domain
VSSEKKTMFALSIKQPWAALVVDGLKSIEIRRWPTSRRGRILIHAAAVPDDRDEAWRHVPRSLHVLAQLRGGVIGSVELMDCVCYADLQGFVKDQRLHYNEPEWFEANGLYGFQFAEPTVLPFQKYPGWFRFFKIPLAPEPVAVDE